MKRNDLPIGFFDSGVGGISVLREACKILPNENYIYFGDSKNAPYGTRSDNEIKDLTLKAIDFLINKKVKALVIACNTATSVAINTLRDTYKDLPIVGIEPAVKPAVESTTSGSIVIMATPMTLKMRKFNELISTYSEGREIIPMPCPGLVEFIEKGIFEGDDLHKFLMDKFKDINIDDVGAVVLGCTHYPFIKKELSKIIDKNKIFDGSKGTANQLKHLLQDRHLLNNSSTTGNIEIINSLNDNYLNELCINLLNLNIK